MFDDLIKDEKEEKIEEEILDIIDLIDECEKINEDDIPDPGCDSGCDQMKGC